MSSFSGMPPSPNAPALAMTGCIEGGWRHITVDNLKVTSDPHSSQEAGMFIDPRHGRNTYLVQNEYSRYSVALVLEAMMLPETLQRGALATCHNYFDCVKYKLQAYTLFDSTPVGSHPARTRQELEEEVRDRHINRSIKTLEMEKSKLGADISLSDEEKSDKLRQCSDLQHAQLHMVESRF